MPVGAHDLLGLPGDVQVLDDHAQWGNGVCGPAPLFETAGPAAGANRKHQSPHRSCVRGVTSETPLDVGLIIIVEKVVSVNSYAARWDRPDDRRWNLEQPCFCEPRAVSNTTAPIAFNSCWRSPLIIASIVLVSGSPGNRIW